MEKILFHYLMIKEYQINIYHDSLSASNLSQMVIIFMIDYQLYPGSVHVCLYYYYNIIILYINFSFL